MTLPNYDEIFLCPSATQPFYLGTYSASISNQDPDQHLYDYESEIAEERDQNPTKSQCTPVSAFSLAADPCHSHPEW